MTKSNTAKQKVVYLDCQKFAAEVFDFVQAYRRIFKEGVQWDAVEGSKAFAFIWTHREANALGKDPRFAIIDDPTLAAELSLRLTQWRKGFLEWYLLVMRKENPGAFDETVTQRSREAAELGAILGDKSERTTDRLIDFIKRRNELSEREHRVFLESALDNKPAKWRHPELDTFLTLMWPIVERFKWTYRDVLDAVRKKFPGEQDYPFNDLDENHPDNIKKHCHGLGLRTVSKARRQHARGKAPLLDLALEISTETDLLRRLGFVGK
jgi:hypothetical protein